MLSKNYIPKKMLITGGCGFIGSNFIQYILSLKRDIKIINLDSLTYAGNLHNLTKIENDSNYVFCKGNICSKIEVNKVMELYTPDCIVNFAAESHVDRSIESPREFFETNVGGTLNLLQAALKFDVERYVQISTDEVYGSLGSKGYFTEETPLSPNSPYSASKASADMFVNSFNKTYNLNTIITRCSNNYGPYQFPEKLIPLMISNTLVDKPLPVYNDGSNIRDWIHVNDHCAGIFQAIIMGVSGNVYNFGGNSEITNLDLVKKILDILGKDYDLITFVKDRLGHDFRYAIDISKSQKVLGWEPQVNFEEGLKETIGWYLTNKKWLELILSKDYRNYSSVTK